MLNEEEESQLEMMLQIIQHSKDVGKPPKLTAYDIEWLAKKLKEVNEEAKAVLNTLVELKPAKEEALRRNPLSVKGPKGPIIIATWSDVHNAYSCIWCPAIHSTVATAEVHSLRHVTNSENKTIHLERKTCQREHCSVCGTI